MNKPFLHALTAALYIVIIVFVIQTIGMFLRGADGTLLIPMTMLALFVLSAAIMGYIFLAEPLQLYFDGRKQEAIAFFGTTVAFFACLVIIAGAVVIATYPHPHNDASSIAENMCGFTVTSLDANAQAVLPLTVTGTVEKPPSGCSWTMFEGQAGSAQLYSDINDEWQTVGTPSPIRVADWTATSTTFSTTVGTNTVAFPKGTPMKIVFTEENPSGNGAVDSLVIPFTLP